LSPTKPAGRRKDIHRSKEGGARGSLRYGRRRASPRKNEKLAAKVAPFIEFTGRVSTETKVRLIQEAWACLYTSDIEGFGLGILEGAACETPCVAYNVPGVRDAVIHGKTGLLVPHRDTKAAAAALAEILRNDQLRKSLAQAARQYANQFNWTICRKLELS